MSTPTKPRSCLTSTKLQPAQPSSDHVSPLPRSRAGQTPVHPDLSPPFPHHRSTSPIASHAPTSSDLDNRLLAMLHQALQRTGRHHRSPIWPPSTTSALHSTLKPTLFDCCHLHPLRFSLSLNLSLFLPPLTEFVNK